MFPYGRFRWGSRQFCAQFIKDLLGGNARTRIVDCRVEASPQQLLTQIDVRLELLVLSEQYENGLAWIEEDSLFNPL